MQKALILIRKAGQSVPVEVLKPLFEKYNRAIGFAFADGQSVRVTRATMTAKWRPSVESFVKGDAQFNDRKVVYCFADIDDSSINNADLQPYVAITGDQNNALCVAFIDGEFNIPTGITQHNQAHGFEKYIKPQLEKSFKYADKDIEKFMVDEMTDDLVGQRMISQIVSSNGSVVILAANDDDLTYTSVDDKTHKEYPWGWLSNTEFLPIAVAEEKVEETSDDPFQQAASPAPAPAPAAGFRKSAPAVASVPASPAPVSTPASPSAPPSPAPAEEGEDWVKVTVPKNCDTEKSRGNFLRSRYPYALPENWAKTMFAFEIPLSAANDKLKADLAAKKPFAVVFKKTGVEGLVEKFNGGAAAKQQVADVKPAAAANGGFRRPAATAVAEAPVQGPPAPQKDTTVHNIGETRPGIVSKVWLIPPVEKADMVAFMNKPEHEKALDRNSQNIPDPSTFIELDNQSFAKQLNIKGIDDIWSTVNWDEDQELPMVKMAPHTAMAYIRDWKTTAIKLRHQLLELQGKKLEQEAAQQQPTEQPKAAVGGFRRRA